MTFQVVLALGILLAILVLAVLGTVMRSRRNPESQKASMPVSVLIGVGLFLILVMALAIAVLTGIE